MYSMQHSKCAAKRRFDQAPRQDSKAASGNCLASVRLEKDCSKAAMQAMQNDSKLLDQGLAASSCTCILRAKKASLLAAEVSSSLRL